MLFYFELEIFFKRFDTIIIEGMTMKNKLSNHKTLYWLLGIVFVIMLICILPYIITGKPFVIGWDMRTQYAYFYENLKTMMRDSLEFKSLPFYSWSSFLGNNFWGSKIFYYHNIFDYLSVFFARGLSYSNIIILQTMAKMLIAAFSFYIYGKTRKFNNKSLVYGGVCFALSSWALEAIKDPFFLAFYAFIPLYFASIEVYFKSKKKIGFILITTFLAITNYYSFYSLSCFTVIYYIYRYIEINKNSKGLFKSVFPLIGAYFIAIFIAGFALLPQAISILNNVRVGKSSAFLVYDSIQPYFDILLGFFTPTSMLMNRGFDFNSIFNYITANDTVLALYIWTGSINAFLFFQNLFSKDKVKRNLLLGLLAMLMIPFMNSLMHGFSEPAFRWGQLIVFMTIVMAIPYIEDHELINKKVLRISYIVMVALLVVAPLVLNYVFLHNDGFIKEYILILVNVLFITIAYIILNKGVKFTGLMIFTLIEITFVAFMSLFGNSYYRQFDKTTITGVENVLLGKDELNNYLLELDSDNSSSLYRLYIPVSSVYWDYATNLNLKYNIMGLMAYDSTYSPSIIQMNDISKISTYLPWAFQIENPNLIDYFGTKYAIVTGESDLPHNNFKKVGDFNYLEVYENLNYSNFARVYTNVISEADYKGDSSVILDTLIVNDEQLVEISNLAKSENLKGFDWVNKSANSLQGGITLDNSGFMVVPIPYDKGWKVSVNGNNVKTYDVQGGTLGFGLEPGYNEIQCYFTPQGFKAGFIVSLVGICLFGMVVWKEKSVRKDK